MDYSLHYACVEGNVQCLREILDNEGNVDIEDNHGYTPLHVAAEYGQVECIKILLEYSRNIIDTVNSITKNGYTPLHLASLEKNTSDECVKILLESGANINVLAMDRETPLHFASLEGHIERVKMLLERGADINIKNRMRKIPLLCAINKYNEDDTSLEIIKILIRGGSDINCVDFYESNLLHYASEYEKIKCVQYLLECGLNFNVKNSRGETAYELGNDEIRKIFDNFESLEIKQPEE